MKTSFIAELASTLACIDAIKPVLKREYGALWLLNLLGAFGLAEQLFKRSRWGGHKTAEAAYAKTLMIFPAFYIMLKKKYKDKELVMEVSREIITGIVQTADSLTTRNFFLDQIGSPFERWLKYRSTLIMEGFGRFNTIEDVYISRHRMHYVVRRCIFHDVFTEAGAPELTPIICDYDFKYHSAVFREFYFDRNGNPNNTIGHGAELCHYVWKDKRILNDEFKEHINTVEAKPSLGERRGTPRRQADRRQTERRNFDRRTLERRVDVRKA